MHLPTLIDSTGLVLVYYTSAITILCACAGFSQWIRKNEMQLNRHTYLLRKWVIALTKLTKPVTNCTWRKVLKKDKKINNGGIHLPPLQYWAGYVLLSLSRSINTASLIRLRWATTTEVLSSCRYWWVGNFSLVAGLFFFRGSLCSVYPSHWQFFSWQTVSKNWTIMSVLESGR